MSGEVNWRMKYQELKSKYMNAVDMAFRLGVEEGLKQGQLDSAQQQLAQAQEQAAGAMAGGPGGDPAAGGGAGGQLPGGKVNNNGAPGTPDQGEGNDKSGAASVQPGAAPAPMAESEHPEGSELDQHIATLEGMLKKNEGDEKFDAESIEKSISGLKKLKFDMHQRSELKKSHAAISNIAKAMHKPQFKFGVQANHNLSTTAKAAATMQHEIVQDVFKKWEEEEKKASKDILSTLNIEGIVKGK